MAIRHINEKEFEARLGWLMHTAGPALHEAWRLRDIPEHQSQVAKVIGDMTRLSREVGAYLREHPDI